MKTQDVHDAKLRAKEVVKSLRHVLNLPHQDVAVYEDRDSGERRKVTGKQKATYGLAVAWELADPDPIFVNNGPEHNPPA